MKATKILIVAGGVVALSVVTLGGSSRVAHAASGAEALAARKAVMRSISGHFGAIKGAILSGNKKRIQGAARHAMAINGLSRSIAFVTPKGSGQSAGKSTALNKIWTDWAGFNKAAGRLTTESAKLVAVLKAGNPKASMSQFGRTGKVACGGCHGTYRVKKKKR